MGVPVQGSGFDEEAQNQMTQNPYQAPESIGGTEPTMHWLMRVITVGVASYPLIAVALIYITVIMESWLGMRGAVIHSFATPLGVVFTVSAYLVMGTLLFTPVGFIASLFVASAIGQPKRASMFPVIYIVLCIASLLLMLIDPGGFVAYYFD